MNAYMSGAQRLWLIYLSKVAGALASPVFDLALYLQGVSIRAEAKAHEINLFTDGRG